MSSVHSSPHVQMSKLKTGLVPFLYSTLRTVLGVRSQSLTDVICAQFTTCTDVNAENRYSSFPVLKVRCME
jgi:hypothetical protein